MKRIKLLSATIATALAITTPLCVTLASCSCNKGQQDHDIEIKTNPHISIECKEVIVGQDLIMTYKLDNNYSFDVAESTITFHDTNIVVQLWQCDIDLDNKTITVPALYVTTRKVTIDIKASDASDNTVNQAEYTKAISKLKTIDSSRKLTLDGYALVCNIDKDGKVIVKDKQEEKLIGDGLKEHLQLIDEGTVALDRWIEPDSIVGYWQYDQEKGATQPILLPVASTIITDLVEYQFSAIFSPQISDWTFNPILSAYTSTKVVEGVEITNVLVFENKQITSYGGLVIEEAESGSYNVDSITHYVTYNAESITLPQDYQIISKPNMFHILPTKYTAGDKKLTYSYDGTDTWGGRYLVPMYKCNNWSESLPFTISINAALKTNVEKLRVEIATGNRVLKKNTDYTIDTETGDITVNAGVIDCTTELRLILGIPLAGSPVGIQGFRSLTISQE